MGGETDIAERERRVNEAWEGRRKAQRTKQYIALPWYDHKLGSVSIAEGSIPGQAVYYRPGGVSQAGRRVTSWAVYRL